MPSICCAAGTVRIRESMVLRSDAYTVEFFRIFEHMRFRNEVEGTCILISQVIARPLTSSPGLQAHVSTPNVSLKPTSNLELVT